MQQASSLASLSAALPHTFPEFTKVPGYRAWATRAGAVWEYNPKTTVWRLCPTSRAGLGNEYYQVSMTADDGKRKQRLLHNVIYETFHTLLQVGDVVDHDNDNPSDNRCDNLVLSNNSDNTLKSYRKGPRARHPVKATHRDGTALSFPSYRACDRHFGLTGNNQTRAAVRRGDYAKRSHSPFKDWIVTYA